jgi:tetratricopeptide (TPR) repeat protein
MENIDVVEYLTQGFVMLSLKKFDEALGFLNKAEAIEPLNAEVYIRKGLVYQELEQYDEAKSQFEKALKLNNTDGRIYFHLGGVAALKGDFSGAVELYKKALVNGFHDTFVYFNMGMAYENLNDITFAIKSYKKAAEINPLRPEAGLRMAKLLIAAERFTEAAEAYTAIVRAYPDEPKFTHALFTVYMQTDDFAKAQGVLDEAKERFEGDITFTFDSIALLIAENKREEALAALNTLNESDMTEKSDKRRLHMQKAELYAYADNLNGVIDELQKAKAITEADGTFDAECSLLLIDCFTKTEDYDQVLKNARDILANSDDISTKGSAMYFEPFALKKMGNEAEALPLYRAAIDEYRNVGLSYPGYLDPYVMRAMCHKDLGEYEKATELIDYVLSLKPDLTAAKALREVIVTESKAAEDK